jgi:hypothetical protein
MKNLCKCVLVLLALAAFSATASAQRGMFRSPDMQGIWDPVVGAGGTYEIQKSSGEKSQMDIFIAGKESVGGKDAYWMEMVMQDSKRGSGPFVMKTLSAFDGTSLEVTRVVIQMAGQNPMEMPMQMSGQSKRNIDIKSNGKVVGTETVTTPAGTFTAEHWHSNDGADVWVSSKVPPYGLVKTTNSDGTTMTLIHQISDAKDRITGTPQPFNPMNMAPKQ